MWITENSFSKASLIFSSANDRDYCIFTKQNITYMLVQNTLVLQGKKQVFLKQKHLKIDKLIHLCNTILDLVVGGKPHRGQFFLVGVRLHVL